MEYSEILLDGSIIKFEPERTEIGIDGVVLYRGNFNIVVGYDEIFCGQNRKDKTDDIFTFFDESNRDLLIDMICKPNHLFNYIRR